MAKVQYAAPISAISGSIGGWTFQTNRSGSIIRLKPKGKKLPTGKTSDEVSEMIRLVAAFTELTPMQKEDWDDFSLVNTHEDRFGNVNTLTGQNWFISINRNRLILGLGILNSPPLATLPDGSALFTLDIDDTKIEVIKTAPISPVDTAYKIFTTPPLNRSTTSLQSALRFTKLLDTIPYNPIDIKADWVSVHGCGWPPGGGDARFTIGVQLQPVRISTGITVAGNTQLGVLLDPPVGIGFMTIGVDFIVS